jgi:hypothetical protein
MKQDDNFALNGQSEILGPAGMEGLLWALLAAWVAFAALRRAGGARGGGAKAPPAAPPPPPPGGARRFGLAAGEAEPWSDDDDDDGAGEELTVAELRRLQASPAFLRWRAARGVGAAELEKAAARLRLLRRLREVDPALFWALARPDSRWAYEVEEPSGTAALLEFIASLTLTAFFVSAFSYVATARPAAALAAPLLLAAWAAGPRAWLAGRPAAGWLFAVWCEEEEGAQAGRGHRAPAARAAAAALLDLLLAAATLGLGAAASAALRLRGRSAGERLAGVRVVRERRRRLGVD